MEEKIKAAIEKALAGANGSILSWQYDPAKKEFDVKIFYPGPKVFAWNWTLVREVDFEENTIFGKISLGELALHVKFEGKDLAEAIMEKEAGNG